MWTCIYLVTKKWVEISFLRMFQFDEQIVWGQQFGVGGSNSAE